MARKKTSHSAYMHTQCVFFFLFFFKTAERTNKKNISVRLKIDTQPLEHGSGPKVESSKRKMNVLFLIFLFSYEFLFVLLLVANGFSKQIGLNALRLQIVFSFFFPIVSLVALDFQYKMYEGTWLPFDENSGCWDMYTLWYISMNVSDLIYGTQRTNKEKRKWKREKKNQNQTKWWMSFKLNVNELWMFKSVAWTQICPYP